jgi:hypothetical protein
MIFSVLHRLKRWDDIIRLCPDKDHHLRYFGLWKIRALAALGNVDDAVNLADRLTENRWAYRDYTGKPNGFSVSAGEMTKPIPATPSPVVLEGTYLAHYRRLKKDYPSHNPERILDDLLSAHPEKPGAWFAAIRREGFLDRAADLARNHPVNPNTCSKPPKTPGSPIPISHWTSPPRPSDGSSRATATKWALRKRRPPGCSYAASPNPWVGYPNGGRRSASPFPGIRMPRPCEAGRRLRDFTARSTPHPESAGSPALHPPGVSIPPPCLSGKNSSDA